MSATVNTFCLVQNLDEIKTSLVPEDKTKQEIYRDDDWDNRWNWDTSELIYEDDNEKKNLWLNDCLIAISPFTDVFVIGRLKTLSIFNMMKSMSNNKSSNNDDNSSAFNLIYTTTLPGLEPDETLTSLKLLPFVSHQKSVVNFRDWTAIVGGFSSGYFRIYSENGKALMSHLFHDEPILDIKCRTYSSNHLLADQTDEILIIYPTAVIQIDGFTLLQTLRLCRNRLTKSYEIDSSGKGYFNLKDNNNDNQTPFTFKKWTFQTPSDGQVYDCVSVCSFVKNDFDALVSHSINGETFNNDSANLFFTTGTNPYVGFYRTREGTTHAIIDELSQFLINRVKNVFSFFNQQKELDPREKIKPSTIVKSDLTLFDERLGTKICLSPNRRLAAVTDDFGRVILFDLQNMIAVRIWKGYRKAEVGWIVVDEGNNSSSVSSNQQQQENNQQKQAHFLLIYVPKRGILEIWCTQNGPRVTAFNVGKNCRLLYTDHTMFGLNYLILQNIKQSMSHSEFQRYFSQSRCFLFNFETATIYTFQVPFLCSLTDRNSKKTRDVHILKDLQSLLNKKDTNDSQEKKKKFYENVVKLILMLKTAEIRRESIDLIQTSDDPELILLCAEKLLADLLTILDKNELDFENKLIAQMCARIIQLCRYYISVQQKMSILKEKFQEIIEKSEQPPDIHQLIEDLDGWSGSDVVRILSLLAFRQSVLKCTKNEDNDLNQITNLSITISEMLSHFTLYYNHLVKHQQQNEMYDKLPVEIIMMQQTEIDGKNENQQQQQQNSLINFEKLSCFLFWSTFCEDDGNIQKLLNEVCIFPSNLLLLLFDAWLNSKFSIYWNCWRSFSRAFITIVNTISESQLNKDLENDENLEQSDNHMLLFDFSNTDDHLSASWTDIITLIYKSTNITSAFIAINMIKALVHKIKLEKKAIEKKEKELNMDNANNDDDDNVISSTQCIIASDNEWETLHLDKENLSLLAKQLEDLFLLDLLLKSCANQKETNQTNTSDGYSKNIIENISLSFILTSGPGIVSEIVARWAVFHQIKPELLMHSSRTDAHNSDLDDTMVNKDDRIESGSNAVNELANLNANSTLIEVLDHVRRCFPNCLDSDILLINCFWEILVQWNSQPLFMSDKLSKAMEYLVKVSSSVLKHNVSTMAWRIFVQKRFEILCNLIEKMGKKPKDRILRKELEMDENNLEQFSYFCCEILDFMISTSATSETEPLPLFTMDDWWQSFNCSNNHYNNLHYNDNEFSKYNSNQQYDHSTNSSNKIMATNKNRSQFLTVTSSSSSSSVFNNINNTPLAVMAMHQKTANIDLLIEYHHLSQCIQFIVVFSLRNVRPLSLFPSSVRAYFFKDLFSFLTLDSSSTTTNNNSTNNITLPTDPVLKEMRIKFFYIIITGIVQPIPVHRKNDNNEDKSNCQNAYINANQWFQKCIQLAKEWNLDIDKIRLQYVYELFLYGCDPLAQELMSTVSDTKALSRKLLVVAGMRIATMLNSKYSSLDEVSFLAPNVLFWIKSLVMDPNCASDIPINCTVLLLEKISNFLYDDQPNYRICEELLSALKRFYKDF